jgi:hypothetical protein
MSRPTGCTSSCCGASSSTGARARRRRPVPRMAAAGDGYIAAPSNRATSRAGAPATRTTPWSTRCMRQLVATGWMSNRGRQIAASCLITRVRHRLALRCRILRKTPDRLRRRQQLRELAVHRRCWRRPARRPRVQHREADRAIRSGGRLHGEVGRPPTAAAALRDRRRRLAPRSRGLTRMARGPAAEETEGGEDLPGLRAPVSLAGALEAQLGSRWCTARDAAPGRRAVLAGATAEAPPRPEAALSR